MEKDRKKAIGRIEGLVSEHKQPLDASLVPKLYLERYKKVLDYKRLGYDKLKDFLTSIPSVKSSVSLIQKNSQLCLVWKGRKTDETKTRKKANTSASDTSQPNPPVTASLVADIQRIQKLVEQHSPLLAAMLPSKYEEAYGRPLNFKKHGFSKIKSLLVISPSIALSKQETGPLTLSWHGGVTSRAKLAGSLSGATVTQQPPTTNTEMDHESADEEAAARPQIAPRVSLQDVVNLMAPPGSPVASQQENPLVADDEQLKATIDASQDSPVGLPWEEPDPDAGYEHASVFDQDSANPFSKTSSEASYKDQLSTTNTAGDLEERTSPSLDEQDRAQVASHASLDDASATTLSEIATSVGSHREDPFDTSSTCIVHTQATAQGKLQSYFAADVCDNDERIARGVSLGDQTAADSFREAGLLGRIQPDKDFDSGIADAPVYVNTHEPFCLATVGVQGAGKSHTLACVLESCLIPFQVQSVSKLRRPMTALVLHYDQNTTSICEAAGLLSPAPVLKEHLHDVTDTCFVPSSKATVLVSPTYYKQRKAFYGDHISVRPLLLRWHSLTADHIKRIMGIGADDNQLYVASCMSLLRKYQRSAVVPAFADFIEEIKEVCTIQGQKGPLSQRIALLESVIAESEVNSDIADESMDVSKACEAGLNLIIADLTDPLLSKEEANGLFQVITEQFRSIPIKGGKLLALDEAHKFMIGDDTDGLSEAIVNVARLMRHDGVRLAVSTQSPKALAPELLELVSVAVLHQFHSQDWWTYLRRKMPLPDSAWEKILSLRSGNAIVFASRSSFSGHSLDGGSSSRLLPLRIRPRITADFGSSRTNN